MNSETQKRTVARVAASTVEVMAVWKFVYEIVFSATEIVWLAAVVATVLALACLAVDAWTTYYNNDYTPESAEGTYITRLKKIDPNVVIDVYDPDEDDSDEDDDEAEADADAEAEEGEPDETVEQE